jgi:hypothetical protein
MRDNPFIAWCFVRLARFTEIGSMATRAENYLGRKHCKILNADVRATCAKSGENDSTIYFLFMMNAESGLVTGPIRKLLNRSIVI